MLPRDIPDGPWQDIAVDYMMFKGHEYLIICDTFSKYPFVYKVTAKICPIFVLASAWAHLTIWTSHITVYWQWSAICFIWARRVPYMPLHSTPYIISPFPQVQWFYRKASMNNQDCPQHCLTSQKPLEAVLLDLRSTPIGSNMPALHEILHNRTIQWPGRNFLISKRQAQCDQFNKAHGVQALPELPPGQEVLFRSPVSDEYIPGTT